MAPGTAAADVGLEVTASDLSMFLMILDEGYNCLASGVGYARGSFPPGLYRARLVTPEGLFTEQVVWLKPGQALRTILLDAPLIAPGWLLDLAVAAGFELHGNNTLVFREGAAISLVSAPTAATLLALAVQAEISRPAETSSPVPDKRRLFEERLEPGVAILIAQDPGAPGFAGSWRIECWPQHGTAVAPPSVPERNFALAPAGVQYFALGIAPGMYWLRFRSGAAAPDFLLSMPVLEEKVTLVAVEAGHDQLPAIYVSFLDPVPMAPETTKRQQLMQRFYRAGRLDIALQYARALVKSESPDPLAECARAYLALMTGDIAGPDFQDQGPALHRRFSGLSDVHVLRAEYLLKQNRNSLLPSPREGLPVEPSSEASRTYQEAAKRGVPFFAEGFTRLVDASERMRRFQDWHPDQSVEPGGAFEVEHLRAASIPNGSFWTTFDGSIYRLIRDPLIRHIQRQGFTLVKKDPLTVFAPGVTLIGAIGRELRSGPRVEESGKILGLSASLMGLQSDRLPRNAGLTLLRLLLHGAGLPAAGIMQALARTYAMQFVIGRTGIRVSERPLLEARLSSQGPALTEAAAGEPLWLITSVLTIAELNVHLNGWFDIPKIQAAAGVHVEVRQSERGVIFKFAGEGVDFAFQARRVRHIDGKFDVTQEIYRSAELFQAIDVPQTLEAVRGDIVPRSGQRDDMPVYGTSSPTILLVDKEDFTRRLCTSILRDCGYRVIEASSGLDAIKLAQRHQSIDVLLTDMTMPYFSGADLAHSITGFHPDIRVLFMSGKGGYSPGQGKIVQKPFTREALARQIRDLLKY